MQQNKYHEKNHRTCDFVSISLPDVMEIPIVSYFFDTKSLDLLKIQHKHTKNN